MSAVDYAVVAGKERYGRADMSATFRRVDGPLGPRFREVGADGRVRGLWRSVTRDPSSPYLFWPENRVVNSVRIVCPWVGEAFDFDDTLILVSEDRL